MMQFVIFFSIVLLVYGSVNAYIFYRGLSTMPADSLLRFWYIVAFWTLAGSFVLGRILEKVYLSHVSDLFTWAGSFWLAAMLYLFLAVVLFDLIRLVNHVIPFLHYFSQSRIFQEPIWITVSVATAVFLIVLGGHINALHPRIKELTINTGVRSEERKSLKLAVATDVHLGTIISTKRLTKMVNLINSQKPDVILFAGDIVDEDLAPVISQNLGSLLTKLEAPLGVFGTTGNHEYIGGAAAAVEYLSKHGINMLGDSMIQLTPEVTLAAREDIERNRFAGKNRKSLHEVVKNKPDETFLVLLDHQPRAIPEAVEANTGLLLCGHTHHGQLWPLNYITQAAFPVSWGYKKFENTHVYVSSGIGSWGPPVRIGNRPEVVVITLTFE